MNEMAKGCCILLLVLVLIEGVMAPSFSQTNLSYTVNVSIPNRRIINLWERRVNLTFTISGLVDFLNATVQVHSDTANLLANTFYLHGYYVGTNGVTYQWLDEYPRSGSEQKTEMAQYSFRGINCEWIDYDVCSRYSMYMSTIKIDGNLILDTSAMNPGSYRVEVAFVVHTIVTDYRFSDSITYEVLDFWQTYFWVPSAILAAIVIFAVVFLVSWFRSKRPQ